MTDRTPPASRPLIGVKPAPAPSLDTVVRLLEQSIEEQRDTKARLDAHIEISAMRFSGLEKQLDGVRDISRAQHLTLANDLADVRRHVGQIEEHVGFLTAKTTEHDARFDRIDARLGDHDTRFDNIDTRLDNHDTRFDNIDTRLDNHDTRFDNIDTRFDNIDSRLGDLSDAVLEIRDAILPRAGEPSPTP